MKSMKIITRKYTRNDADSVYNLYKRVASIEGGLARTKDEITPMYISSFIENSLRSGYIFVAEDSSNSVIAGEIHCYSPGIKVFTHILSELTIAVDPDYQGQGIGRLLFEELIKTVKNERADILRIELIVRESNSKAIKFYQSLGFAAEGRFEQRIKSVNGGYEADIPMAWVRNDLGNK